MPCVTIKRQVMRTQMVQAVSSCEHAARMQMVCCVAPVRTAGISVLRWLACRSGSISMDLLVLLLQLNHSAAQLQRCRQHQRWQLGLHPLQEKN